MKTLMTLCKTPKFCVQARMSHFCGDNLLGVMQQQIVSKTQVGYRSHSSRMIAHTNWHIVDVNDRNIFSLNMAVVSTTAIPNKEQTLLQSVWKISNGHRTQPHSKTFSDLPANTFCPSCKITRTCRISFDKKSVLINSISIFDNRPGLNSNNNSHLKCNSQHWTFCQKHLIKTGISKWHKQRNLSHVNLSSRQYVRFYSANNINESGMVYRDIRLKPPWRIMFFGTDEIAEHTLKELYHNMSTQGTLVEALEVVTGKEQRAVRRFAEKVDLKIHGWPIDVQHGKFDVGVLVSFGHLIPDAVIHMFPYGILNMHPSLLPRWRGASPVIHTILNGDENTGVSIMDIRPKHFDIGPVLLQRSFQVPHRCTSFQLAEIAGQFGAHMMMECLHDLPTLEKFEHEQAPKGITYAHKIKHVNANIDWVNQTAHQVDCQYRAISELMPLKTEYRGHVVKLLDVVDPNIFNGLTSKDVRGYVGDVTLAAPGTVVYHKKKKCLLVKCKDGFVGFRRLVLKRKLSAADFYNGYLNKNTQSKFTSLENELNKYIKLEKIPACARG